MRNWKARVNIGGKVIEIVVQARCGSDARVMIEGQHGKGSITIGPLEAR